MGFNSFFSHLTAFSALSLMSSSCLGVSAIDTTLGIAACSLIPGIVDTRSPVYSPDGTKIVFVSKAALDGVKNGIATASYNIWIANADGSSATALTRNSVSQLDSLNPQFSPDGATIVFQSKMPLSGAANGTPNPSYNIWTIPAAGGTLTALTQNTLANLDSRTPVYSPDQLLIVFASKTDVGGAWDTPGTSSYNIWQMDTTGAARVALTTNTATYLDSSSPQVSPDNLTVVFSSYTSTGGAMNTVDTFSANIVSVPVGGGALTFWTQNTNPYQDSIEPQFFPDATGSQIAYSSKRSTGGAWNTLDTYSYNIWLTNTVGPAHGFNNQHAREPRQLRPQVFA